MLRHVIRPAALALALLVALVSCTAGDDSEPPPAAREPERCVWTIGTMGGGQPENEALRDSILRGIRLAVAEAHEGDTLACELRLREETTRPDPADRVPPLTQAAQRMVEDDTLVACVCPYFSGETVEVGPLLSEAGIPFVSADPDAGVAAEGYDGWYRAVPGEDVQAEAAADYLAEGLGPETTAIVHDNRPPSRRFATTIKRTLRLAARGPFIVSPEATDYTGVVKQIKTLDPDLVYFAGDAPEAARLVTQLRQRKVPALFVASGTVKQPEFGAIAQDAGEGAVALCGCVDPVNIPSAQPFASAMKTSYGSDAPGAFSAEMYDVTALVVRALEEVSEGEAVTEIRAHISDFFFSASGVPGVARDYSWDSQGDLEVDPLAAVWVYEYDKGSDGFVPLGPVEDLM